MKFHIIIEEDSITPYLDDIHSRLNASKEEIAYKIGKRFATKASEDAPQWTGNLESSADDPSDWQLFDDGDFIELNIVFTGLADDVDEWWWEFENPLFPQGGRDYAYFQETGKDIKASPDKARDKWYVRRNVKPTQKFAEDYLKREIRRIMKAQG